jgi:hypothetical protein
LAAIGTLLVVLCSGCAEKAQPEHSPSSTLDLWIQAVKEGDKATFCDFTLGESGPLAHDSDACDRVFEATDSEYEPFDLSRVSVDPIDTDFGPGVELSVSADAVSPDPLPVGSYTLVAATIDGRATWLVRAE